VEHQVAAQVNEDAISFLQLLANGATICCTRRKMQSASAA